MEYALINPQGQIDRRCFDIDPMAGTKPGYKWLPCEGIKPAFSNGEVIEGPVTTIEETKVVDTWSVRPKTAAELTAEKQTRVDLQDALILRMLYNADKRLRVLESKPAITFETFKAFIRDLA